MRKHLLAGLPFALSCALPVLASAGLVLQWKRVDAGQENRSKVTIYFQNGKIRLEEDMTDSRSILIFDRGTQVLWMIQPDQNSYMELTPESVENGIRRIKLMAEQMKEIIPEITDMPAPVHPPPPKIVFATRGRGQYGSFSCTEYERTADGEKTAEICGATADQLRIPQSDYKDIQTLADLSSPVLGSMIKSMLPSMEQTGLPVHSVFLFRGQRTREQTLIRADQRSLDASLFLLPVDLKKVQFPAFGSPVQVPR